MRAAGALDAGNLQASTAALGRPIETLADLHALGLQFGRSQLWIHPSAMGPLGLPEKLPAAPAVERAREGVPHPFIERAGIAAIPYGLAPWVVAIAGRPGEKCGTFAPRVDIAFVAYDEWSGLDGAARGREILDALDLYRGLVGIPYARSPGATSGRLIRHVHRRGTPLERSFDPPPPAEDPATESDFRWARAPSLIERGRRWIHALDANGLYLGAASSLELGFGEPEHHVNKRGMPLRLDARIPGYWRAEIHHQEPELPNPADPLGRGATGPRWHATPTIELAEELGTLGPIAEAWLYPTGRRYLAPWYERLRDARAALVARPGRPAELALGLVKRTYTVGLGYLAGHFHNPGDELRRPDWRHAVIARARANLYRRILKLAPELRPLAVDVDCLYIASDRPAEELGLPLGPGLGAFKLTGSAPMPEAAGALEARRPLLELRRVTHQ